MNTKRMISFLSAVCLALTGTAANLTAAAATAPPKDGTGTFEGMKYKIMGGKCYITGYTTKLPEELVIPAEIKNAKVIWVDMSAFENCTKLKSVTLPNTLTTLNLYSFKGCTALETINVPEDIQLKEVYKSAFEDTAWLNAKTAQNEPAILGNILVGGDGCKGDVVIPEGVTGLSDGAFEYNKDITGVTFASTMTEVGDWAFMNCDSLKTVTIPGNIEEINEYAFSSCDNLQSVVMEDGVDTIGKSAFSKCKKLKDITFPRSLWTIKNDAFQGCTALESVTLPENFRSVFSGAFTNCTALKEITALGYYSSMSGQKALADENADYGISVSNEGEYSKKFTYNGVIRGYNGSLFEEYAKMFDLKFESLGDAPTSGDCGSDLTWELKDGTLTFSGTGSMESYNPRMLWNGEYTWESYQGVAPWFMYRDSIKNAVLGPYVTSLGGGALYEMPALESVTFLCPKTDLPTAGALISSFLGGSIINNGRNEENDLYYSGVIRGYEGSTAERFAESYSFRFEALEGEPELDEEDVPLTGSCGENALWTLDSKTFVLTISGTGDMQNYDFDSEKTMPPWTVAAASGYVSGIVIGDGITGIGDNAFPLCTAEEVTIPASVKRIGEDAFYQCDLLKKVTILNPDCEIAGAGWTFSTGMRNNEPLFDGKISGYADSTAQKYAEDYGYKFEALENAPAVTTSAVVQTVLPASTTVPVITTTTAQITTVIGDHECLTTAPVPATTTVVRTTAPGGDCDTTTAALTTTAAPVTTVIGSHKETTTTLPASTTAASTTAALTTTTAQVTTAPDDTFRGKCGENATWAFNIVMQHLWIAGEGDMTDYDLSKQESAPWSKYAYFENDILQRIRTIEIDRSITKIGEGAFNGCASVKNVIVPDLIEQIGKNAFTGCAALERITILNPECEITDGALSSGEKDGKAYFDGTIVGFKNSTAQKYAEKNGFKFEELDFDPESLYPSLTMELNVKLVPYLKADGYTEEEQQRFQEAARDFMRKVKTITVHGDYYIENPDSPDGTDAVYDETLTLLAEESDILPLAEYDSAPLGFSVMSKATDSTGAQGSADAVFSFLDENGTELFSLHPYACAWKSTKGFPVYYDRMLTVVDLSKLPADTQEEQKEAVVPMQSKIGFEDYLAEDYDCVTALGDTNGDNAVSVEDAQLALKAYTESVAGLKQNLTQAQRMASDVNRDGEVTVEDAQLILKYYTEKTVAGKNITWKDIRG